MRWEVKKLSDCCVSIVDGDHQPPPKADSGVPFVTISNINSANQFDFSDTMFVPQEYYDRLDSKRKAQKDDILYSVVGSFGIPVFMKETIPFVFQRHIAILRPNDTIFPQFLYYTMLSRDFYMMADVAALGAAQRTVSLTALRNMKIAVPPMDIQKSIVDILSAYDNLIENNQKQIKLLEEAAQRLYKEWFVDLRFPGHETTPIVDGVPEGWEIASIRSVAELKAGGDKPDAFSEEKTNECSIPVFANGVSDKGLMGYTTKPAIVQPSVTISARGTVGVVFLRREPYMPIVRLISVIPKEDFMDVLYLYLFLANQNFRSTGAAQQQITVPLLKDKLILCPTQEIREKFYDSALPIFDKMDVLSNQNNQLAEARDRLLPKLMSGETEV